MSSIIDDVADIGARLRQLEQSKSKEADAKAVADKAIAESWMYYTPDYDTAPSEIFCCYEGPLILTFGYPWLSRSAASKSNENELCHGNCKD